MARTRRRPVLISQLPPTPCTVEMRAAIEKISEAENLSLAEVQRAAYRFFLQANYSFATENSSIANGTLVKDAHP